MNKRGEENIITSKNKGRKINVLGGTNYYGNCPYIYSTKTWIMKDIFKILEDSLPELNEIFSEKKLYANG